MKVPDMEDMEDNGGVSPVPYRDGRVSRLFSGLSWIVLILAVLVWAVTWGDTHRDAQAANAYATLAIWVAGTILTLILFKSFYRRHMAMLLLIQAKALAIPAISPEQAAEFVDRLMGKRVKP